jgi:hypothetical protein
MTATFDYTNPKTGKGFQVLYSSRQTNSTGDVKEVYFSNGGTLNLLTNKVTPEGGLTERMAAQMKMKANLLEPLTLADEGGIETAANTGVDKETLAHMKNWMECTRSRNRKTNADIQAAYDHSVALCMTIEAINTGKKVTFDEKKANVVAA